MYCGHAQSSSMTNKMYGVGRLPGSIPDPDRDDSKCPIKTEQYAAIINGHHTEYVCTKFSNLLFVCVTQYQKLGTLIKVTKENVRNQPTTEDLFTVEVLLGKDDKKLQVLARALAQDISSESNFLFSLALKNTDTASLQIVRKLVMDQQNCCKTEPSPFGGPPTLNDPHLV